MSLSTLSTPQTSAALREFEVLPDDALVGSRVVRVLLGGCSEDTLERRVKAGILPTPRKFPGGRTNHWRVGDLRAVLKGAA